MGIEEYTLSQLKELAKEKEIKNISKLKKEDLINILSLPTNLYEILMIYQNGLKK